MSPKKIVIRKLSLEFNKDIYKDGVKRCLLPGKVLLQSLCCWPDSSLKIAGWFFFWNLFISEIFHATYVFKNFRDIGDAVGAGATVTTNMEGLLRLYIMLTKKDVINSVLVKIWKKFWSVNALEPIRRKQIKGKAQISVLLPCLFLITSITSNTAITCSPFLRNHGLVLKSTFPFDWNQIFIYEFIYIWQYFTDWFVLFMINAFDFFFVSLVVVCATQYTIMQEIFKFILTEESKEHRTFIFGEKGKDITNREMLNRCLEHHKLLIGICNELESSFNIPILIQFFTSTSAICASSLVLKVDSSHFVKMFMFNVAHLLQLFYFCYAGYELMHESYRLGDAIYECNWHLHYDRDFWKALVLMIQRTQKQQCLTAAGITELDFASFLKILRLSFSFYTLLDNLIMKNENL